MTSPFSVFYRECRTFGFFAVAGVTAADIHRVGKTAAIAVIATVFRLTVYCEMKTAGTCKGLRSRLFGKIFTAGGVCLFGTATADGDAVYRTATVFVMSTVSGFTGKIGHNFFSFCSAFAKAKILFEKSRPIFIF